MKRTHIKKKKIFISHANEDKAFASSIYNLLIDMGLGADDITYTPIPESGIKIGNSIYDTIFSTFKEYKLYVIFIESPRFHKKTFPENEVTLTLFCNNPFCSIFTPDMDFKKRKGPLMYKDNIVIRFNDNDILKSRLTELKGLLLNFLGKEDKLPSKTWERKLNQFLKRIE